MSRRTGSVGPRSASGARCQRRSHTVARPPAPPCAGPPAGPDGEVMRLSYHASGVTHFHLHGNRLPPGGPSPAPREVRGWERIAAWSVAPLTWGYKPKPDSAHRFNLTVDADIAPIPIESWVVSLIAAERRRPDAIAAVLEHYRSKQFLIGHPVAECSHVMVRGVLWPVSVQRCS